MRSAAVYCSLMGPEGLRQVNEISAANAHYLVEQLCATGKMEQAYPDKPYLNEALMRVKPGLTASAIIEAAEKTGILAGVVYADDLLLVCATEMQTRDDIDRYVQLVKSL